MGVGKTKHVLIGLCVYCILIAICVFCMRKSTWRLLLHIKMRPLRRNRTPLSNITDHVSGREDRAGFNAFSCNKTRHAHQSRASPPYYPVNGTGALVSPSLSFDPSKVNKLCDADPVLKAILPVYSAIPNHDRRQAIRDTIGQSCIKYRCKIVFIVGFEKNGLLNPKLENEYDTYGDIRFVNRVDSYRDLNDKAVAMLDWLTEVCYQPRFVIHFIDDTFVNLKLFFKDLRRVNDAIYGFVAHRYRPERERSNKYCVSKEEYPYNIYPDFVVGVAYAFPNTISGSLRCAVHDAIYVWLEDVWIMGHVREAAGIKAITTRRKIMLFGIKNWNTVHKCLLVHSVQVKEFYKLQKHLNGEML